MYIRRFQLYLLVPLVINWYLILKIILGQHGILAIKYQKIEAEKNLQIYKELKAMNDNKAIKSSLINEDVINLRYLNELLRMQYSVIMPDEKVIILDKPKKNA